ncbi:MAG: hypothetical protein KJ720_12770 [Proteobacteria bacterium]|nr:hypothetical protein [Pseudomonadota bacterium]MBU1450840.1 hypothetical protein [Pseudomonadota bacterium]MBU2470057.1 hypothetical protein [Pseudomonadota bacterium]MBU2518445.1 hypothetical protein [Pseudomonadota bacterium]
MKAMVYGWLGLAVLSLCLVVGGVAMADDSGTGSSGTQTQNSGQGRAQSSEAANSDQWQSQLPPIQTQPAPSTNNYEVHISGTTVSGTSPVEKTDKDQ